ncbi:MAG: amidohydrolase family protein [Candidatus Eiseniibacteriota bacterium]
MSESARTFHLDPKKPDIALPKDACDSHCHVFGPADRFPYAPQRTYTPVDVPKEHLFRLHRHLGLTRGVIVQASCHGSDNRALVDALLAGQNRYRGIAMVKGDVTEAALRELDEAGVRGVRFNFVRHLGAGAAFEAMRAVIKKIRPLGWHVVVHFDADRLADLVDELKTVPVPMIIDHMGRPDASLGVDQAPFQLLLELIQDDRFWVKVSGSERITRQGPPYDDAVPFARALMQAVPDRVLWGTDFPHPNIRPPIPDDGALVDLLARIAPTPAELKALLVDNPTRLYWSE